MVPLICRSSNEIARYPFAVMSCYKYRKLKYSNLLMKASCLDFVMVNVEQRLTNIFVNRTIYNLFLSILKATCTDLKLYCITLSKSAFEKAI